MYVTTQCIHNATVLNKIVYRFIPVISSDICAQTVHNVLLLYLYCARNKITQLSIPTHAQLQRHRLKFIKNHLNTPTCFGLRPSSWSYNVLAKITIIIDNNNSDNNNIDNSIIIVILARTL